MEASLDTNAIIHLYNANYQPIKGNILEEELRLFCNIILKLNRIFDL